MVGSFIKPRHNKKQPVFPGCPLALTLKEAPKKGKGRMHKLVWFSHEKGKTNLLI
jgi:hypothetical protein